MKLWQYEDGDMVVILMMHEGLSLCLRNDFYAPHVGKIEAYNDDGSNRLDELLGNTNGWSRLL